MSGKSKKKLSPSEIFTQLCKLDFDARHADDPTWTFEKSVRHISEIFPGLYKNHLESIRNVPQALL